MYGRSGSLPYIVWAFAQRASTGHCDDVDRLDCGLTGQVFHEGRHIRILRPSGLDHNGAYTFKRRGQVRADGFEAA